MSDAASLRATFNYLTVASSACVTYLQSSFPASLGSKSGLTTKFTIDLGEGGQLAINPHKLHQASGSASFDSGKLAISGVLTKVESEALCTPCTVKKIVNLLKRVGKNYGFKDCSFRTKNQGKEHVKLVITYNTQAPKAVAKKAAPAKKSIKAKAKKVAICAGAGRRVPSAGAGKKGVKGKAGVKAKVKKK
ncbi:MAG: hypothetical protein L7U87_04890 [Chlamydiales bacterium]|nr:hypothetical protein [Chlamydiales bacterium]